jgi:HAD superfamily hydrolase (TIGR01484 family)
LACATGRDWAFAEPVISSLGLTSPSIIEGGTRIVHSATGQTIWEKALDPGVANQLLKQLKSRVTTGKLMTSANPAIHPLESVTSLEGTIRFVYLIEVDQPTANALVNEINSQDAAVAHVTPAWTGDGRVDIHITHPRATKEYAIKVWQEMQGVSTQETIGIGDSGNDMPIFMASGLKVAVGNATGELMELADYIAPGNTDHALEHIIDKYLSTRL